MKLKDYYKQELKTVAHQIKVVKPAFRKVASLTSKNLGETSEALEFKKVLNSHPHLLTLRERARYLNLAYGLIRGMDLTRVETKPRYPHSERYLTRFMETMEKDFQTTTTKAEAIHE